MAEDLVTRLLAGVGEETLTAFVLVLARVAPLFVVAPLFSSRTIPTRARGVVAVALAVGLTPVALRDAPELPRGALEIAGLLGKEALVGAAFAFVIAGVFWAVQSAGAMLDVISGFAYGSLVDPLTGASSSILTQIYGLFATMIFIAIGGDALVIQGVARTYELVPLAGSPDLGPLVAAVGTMFFTLFVAAIQVAAPVILALVLTDAAFGLVSRVVPTLNVFAVGFPAKIAISLLVIGVSLPFVAGWISDELERSVGTALDAVGAA